MRYIGRWMKSLKDVEYRPPHELVAEYDDATRQTLVNYLKSGHELWAYRGYTYCLLECDHSEPFSELTDGSWVWPCDLSHYVAVHSVRLPDDFVSHAMKSTRLPEFDPQWSESPVDYDYWLKWSNQNATFAFKDVIDKALADANQKAENRLNLQAQLEEARLGISEATCLWAGCECKALCERVLCARCSLRGYEDQYVSDLFLFPLRAMGAADSK